MLDLGIESYLLNSSLSGVVAQRLVRKVCPGCSAQYEPTPEDVDFFNRILGRPPRSLVKGKGCKACGLLGYKGRIGIYEVLQMTPRVRSLLREKPNESELRDKIFREGRITTLLSDGLEKAEQGLTTVSEIFRNGVKIF